VFKNKCKGLGTNYFLLLNKKTIKGIIYKITVMGECMSYKKMLIMIILLVTMIPVFSDNIIDFSGKVEIKRRGENWKKVHPNMNINRGDHVRTLPLSRCSIKLYDGSIIRLEPDTLIKRRNKNSYEINGMGALEAKDLKRSLRFYQGKNYFEFEAGSFIITANSNFMWGISNDNEFWAKGPDGKIRVLNSYQTITTHDYGPVEPEPASISKEKMMAKARLNDVKEDFQTGMDEPFKQGEPFFVKFKGLKICNVFVDEKDEIFINKEDLIRGNIVISGEIGKSFAKDIRSILISVDGGKTYLQAEGVSPFRYQFEPQAKKTYLIKILARDTDGFDSGKTFYSVKVTYLNENDRHQLERYMESLVYYLKNEEYSGVLAYFDQVEYRGNMNIISDNLIDFFYDKDFFYIHYDIRNFVKFDKSIEIGVDWESDLTYTEDGKTEKVNGFTLFKFRKNDENRWRIFDILDGSLFGISVYR